MDFILVGAGNVATHMGSRLVECGHRVLAVYSRTAESAGVLADSLGAQAVTSVDKLPRHAHVCLSMLTDSALPALAAKIVERCGNDTIYIHTAGSVSMDVWKNAGARHYGVLYPMVSFSKDGSVEWKNVPLFIESDSPSTMGVLRPLAEQLSPGVTELDSQGRRYLHLAAVFANNFSNHMYSVSQMLLREYGVPFRVMLPLIRAAVDKLETMDPVQAQTGPAARGDSKVVNEHLDMLSDHPQWKELYRLISTDINDSLK